jgi:hypothetical protein
MKVHLTPEQLSFLITCVEDELQLYEECYVSCYHRNKHELRELCQSVLDALNHIELDIRLFEEEYRHETD